MNSWRFPHAGLCFGWHPRIAVPRIDLIIIKIPKCVEFDWWSTRVQKTPLVDPQSRDNCGNLGQSLGGLSGNEGAPNDNNNHCVREMSLQANIVYNICLRRRSRNTRPFLIIQLIFFLFTCYNFFCFFLHVVSVSRCLCCLWLYEVLLFSMTE